MIDDNLDIIDWTDRLDKDCYNFRQRFLVLHHTENETAEDTLNAFNSRKVSSHYIVAKDGKIYRAVNDEERAWHAGASYWNDGDRTNLNDSSIGIEIVNSCTENFSEEQMDSVIKLSKYVIDKYKIQPRDIVGHADIAPDRKQDPSGYFNWEEFYNKLCIFPHLFESKLTLEEKEVVIFEESEIYSDDVKNLQERLNKYGYRITADGYYDNQTNEVTQAFNRHFCPEIFIKEEIKGGRTIENPYNQKWYKISQERLNNLIREI